MSKTTNKHPQFRLKPTCAAVMLAFTVQSAQANPVGGVVAGGQASFAASGNTLTVTNTPGAIINWQGFSIGANEITRFAQQSASSAVLNRVVSSNPSSILGTLSSNGRVFLINPNGIVFGAGATVDVAGMVASTLNLSNADFQAGRYRFTSSNSPLPLGEGQGVRGVSNAGTITARGDGLGGGQIYLIAPNVENTGIINAPNGEILLAAGRSVELVNSIEPNLRVSITAPAGDATNVGKLVAESGSLGLFGTVIRNSGTVSADSAVSKGGKIVFKASQSVEAGGIISAQGAGGGTINVLADMQTGTVNVTGTLDASALPSPNGGGGDGGFIDTSAAHVQVADTAHITTAASNGKAGTWLIDPTDFTIAAIDPLNGSSYMSNVTLATSLDSGNIIIQTLAAGGGNGDIFVNAAIGKTGIPATTLTLQAHNSIIVSSNNAISSSGGALNVIFNADSDGLNGGAISMATGSSIASNGGNVTLGGGVAGDGSGNAIGGNGITLDGASINAGGGNISLRGTGVAGTGAWRYGVFLQNGATVTSTGTGAITLDGTGGANIYGNYGVMLETGSQISTVDGAIAINGHGIGTTFENVGVGVQLGAKVISTGTGTITLNGTGGAGTNTNRGVYIDGTGTLITSVAGAISITGHGAGTGFDNRGIYLSGGAKVTSTGAANVTLDGTGSAAGTNFNYGVYIKNSGTEVSASSGAVSITGHGAGSGTDNYGVWVTDYAKVASNGAGAITLDGFGGASTGSFNTGAYVSSNATISATGSGGIILNGTGGSSGTAGTSNRGVRVSSAASISANTGDIGITGTGAYNGDGVQVVGGAHVQSNTGAITLLGTATVNGSSSDAVYVTDAGTLITTGGNIDITGDNQRTMGSSNRGVAITSSAHVVATGAGTIIMTGQGGYEGDGLHVHGGALVQSGTGLITLSGTSGDGIGTNWDWGVEVGDPGTLVTSGGGMTITGISTSTDGTYSNYGLFVRTGAKLTTTAGPMTLTGTKGAGATSDAVLLSGTPAGGVVNAAAGLSVTGTGDVVVDTGTTLNVAGNANIFATNNILFAANSSLAPSAGAVNVALNSNSDGTGGGGIYLDTGSSITSNGGNITMGGMPSTGYAIGNGTVTGGITFNSGIYVLGDITAGAGNVTMRGEGRASGSGSNHLADGITFAGGLLSSNGAVSIDGLAHVRSETTAGTEVTAGVDFLGVGTRLSTQTGTVTVTGLNDAGAGFCRAQGITVEAGTIIETTGIGTLTLNGTSTGYDTGWGVGIFGGTVRTTAASGGAITLNGINVTNPDGGVVIWDGHVLSGGGAINLTGQTSPGGSAVGWLNTAPNALELGGPNSGNITIQGLGTTGFIDFNASGGFAHVINAGSSALSITSPTGFTLNNAQISAGSVTLNSGGSATLTGISAGNVSVTASGNILSGSNGAATDITATGTVSLTGAGIGAQSASWPYPIYRVAVDAGGAVTLTTTGAGSAGNIYLRSPSALTLGAVTTAAASAQTVNIQMGGGASLAFPVSQSSNDNWNVDAGGYTFQPSSSLTVGSIVFQGEGTPLTAQGDLTVEALSGDLSFGSTSGGVAISSNGIVTLTANNGTLTLGAVTASNTGLADTTFAVNASASSIDLYGGLTASTSGGIRLLAPNGIELDYNDNGQNPITAAGNVVIQSAGAGIGAYGSAKISGASVTLAGANSVDTGDTITATTGSVTVNSSGGSVVLHGVSAATGISASSWGANSWNTLFSYGSIVSTGGSITLASATTFASPKSYWGGATPIQAVNGNVSVTAPGGISFDTIAGNSVILTSVSAPLLRNAANGTPDLVTANSLSVTAAGGIDLITSVANLQTSNTGAGDTLINNTGALITNGMTNTGSWGSITLNNAGSMTLNGGMSANGRIDLTASGVASDIIVGSTVTSTEDMTVNAGRDLSVGPGGGILRVTAGEQKIDVGRDMSVIQDEGSAYVESLDGELGLQTINVGRNLLVQLNNSSGLEAHIEGAGGQVITVGGNLTMNALDNDQTRINANGGDQTITVGGNMTLNAAQDIAHVRSYTGTQTVSVGGNLNLIGSDAYMYGASGQSITVDGNLNSQGGEIFSAAATTLKVGNDLTLSGGRIWSNGTLYGSVGHNVSITGVSWPGAGLFGTPDIGSESSPFTVGGMINMSDGGGYYGAQIHSGYITSIWIHFPNLSGGGYFVNGTEGVVSSGLSGFYASGSPAFLASNLHITYGLASVPGNNLSFLPDLVNTMLIAGGGASGASRSTIGGVIQGMIGSNDKKPEPDPLPVCPL